VDRASPQPLILLGREGVRDVHVLTGPENEAIRHIRERFRDSRPGDCGIKRMSVTVNLKT